jgi:hypothetical protein
MPVDVATRLGGQRARTASVGSPDEQRESGGVHAVPSDGATPSGGWKEVYAAMGASTSAEGPAPCPDCDASLIRVDADRGFCPDHGFVPAD